MCVCVCVLIFTNRSNPVLAVDDVPLEADLQDPDHIPAADSTPQSSGQRDGSDGVTPDRPEVEAFISDNTDEQTETAPTETEMAPLSKEPVVNEIGTLSFC